MVTSKSDLICERYCHLTIFTKQVKWQNILVAFCEPHRTKNQIYFKKLIRSLLDSFSIDVYACIFQEFGIEQVTLRVILPWIVEVDDDGEQGPITAAAAGDEEGSIAAAEVYLGGGVGLTIFRDDTPAIRKGILESIYIKLKV